jgi:hypothetical protein
MHTLKKIPNGTVICPSCGGPLFPVLKGQQVPTLAVQNGIPPENVAICYWERRFFVRECDVNVKNSLSATPRTR